MKVFRLLPLVIGLTLLIVTINSAPSIQSYDDTEYFSENDLPYPGEEFNEDNVENDLTLLPSLSIQSDTLEKGVNEDQDQENSDHRQRGAIQRVDEVDDDNLNEPSSDSHQRQKRDCQARHDCLNRCKWIICVTRGCGGAKVGCITSCFSTFRC